MNILHHVYKRTTRGEGWEVVYTVFITDMYDRWTRMQNGALPWPRVMRHLLSRGEVTKRRWRITVIVLMRHLISRGKVTKHTWRISLAGLMRQCNNAHVSLKEGDDPIHPDYSASRCHCYVDPTHSVRRSYRCDRMRRSSGSVL